MNLLYNTLSPKLRDALTREAHAALARAGVVAPNEKELQGMKESLVHLLCCPSCHGSGNTVFSNEHGVSSAQCHLCYGSGLRSVAYDEIFRQVMSLHTVAGQFQARLQDLVGLVESEMQRSPEARESLRAVHSKIVEGQARATF